MVQIKAEDSFTGPHEFASLRRKFERPRSPNGDPDAGGECFSAKLDGMTAELRAELADLREVIVDSFDSTERLMRRLLFITLVIVSIALASAATAVMQTLA